jgi:hypothetical protein
MYNERVGVWDECGEDNVIDKEKGGQPITPNSFPNAMVNRTFSGGKTKKEE